ncbi:MAG TPA: cation:proton antiporter [Nevskiaceae bacterium]|nr:cation:proton antiporter [Nevskiaceae bacterium]
MITATPAPATRLWRHRGIQLLMLLVVLGLAWGEQVLANANDDVFAAIAGLGLLFMAGALVSELVEIVGLPHLTGYLLAGLLVGPHVLNLVDHGTVVRLGTVNALALALIALAGGAELRITALRKALKSLAWAHLFQMTAVIVILGATFFALHPFIPFLHGLPVATIAAVALLWGVLAATRSPSALLALIAQYKPKGPLTEWTLAFVMSSDVLVIVVLALLMPVAQATMSADVALGGALVDGGVKLLESGALGGAFGLILMVYLRFSGRNLLFVLLLLGLPTSALLKHLDLDPLLAFVIAGFVVQNFSRYGEHLLRSIEGTADIVFVVFFATAGADLDLAGFLGVWPVAVVLVAVRIAVTYAAARAASRIAGDAPRIRQWGWSGLVSQAGLALGIAVLLAQQFPSFGTGFAALAIGVVGLNEMLGPVFFKIALNRTRESQAAVSRVHSAH